MADTNSPSSSRKATPFGEFETLLAWRYLRARRKDGGASLISTITFVGISVAVAALIVVMSIMGAAQSILVDSLVGGTGHVLIDVSDSTSDEVEELSAEILKIEGIETVSPIVEGLASLDGPYRERSVTVRGIREEHLTIFPNITDSPRNGLYSNVMTDKPTVLVSDFIAAQTYADTGTEVVITSVSNSVDINNPRRANQEQFIVAATYRSGSLELDQEYVLMPLDKAQRFLNKDNTIDMLDVRLDRYSATEAAMARIEPFLTSDMSMADWKTRNSSYLGALQTEKSMLRLILLILVVITSLNIISGTIMLVKNKARDIAILRTMGIPRNSVRRIFILIGSYLGVAGTVTGVIAGSLIVYYFPAIDNFLLETTGARIIQIEIFGLDRLPAKLDTAEIGFTAAWAILLSILVTLSPASKAAATDPVQTLRYE